MVVEYINSNDDAGNLALYGGIAAGAFAGGAALAYRATSPIYKKDKSKAAAIADSVVVKGDDAPTGIGQSKVQSIASKMGNPLRGASESTMASLIGQATNRNLENLTERKGNMKGLSEALVNYGNSERAARANISSDLDQAQDILNRNGGFGQRKAINELLENNPNSYATQEMLSKRVDRAANQPLSQSDLEAQYRNRYAERMAQAEELRRSRPAPSTATTSTGGGNTQLPHEMRFAWANMMHPRNRRNLPPGKTFRSPGDVTNENFATARDQMFRKANATSSNPVASAFLETLGSNAGHSSQILSGTRDSLRSPGRVHNAQFQQKQNQFLDQLNAEASANAMAKRSARKGKAGKVLDMIT